MAINLARKGSAGNRRDKWKPFLKKEEPFERQDGAENQFSIALRI